MIGEKIHQYRKQLGLSQGELANKIDVTRQTVSKWELGETLPDTQNILKLCSVFNISPNALMEENYILQENIPAEKTTTEPKKQYFRNGLILMIVGVLIIGTLLTLSQCIPSRMKADIRRSAIVTVIPGADIVTENTQEQIEESAEEENGDEIIGHEYIEVKSFIPFLNTYYLHWLFISGIVCIIFSIYCFGRDRKEKKHNL